MPVSTECAAALLSLRYPSILILPMHTAMSICRNQESWLVYGTKTDSLSIHSFRKQLFFVLIGVIFICNLLLLLFMLVNGCNQHHCKACCCSLGEHHQRSRLRFIAGYFCLIFSLLEKSHWKVWAASYNRVHLINKKYGIFLSENDLD